MSNSCNRYGFLPYRAADVYKRCVQNQGYASLSSTPVEAESNILSDIVGTEQPIYLDELCRRIAPLYDAGRITDALRNRVVQLVTEPSCLGKTLTLRDSFVYEKSYRDIVVRYRTEDGIHKRDIKNICYEEIMQALLLVLRAYQRMEVEALLSLTSRELGFFRFGDMIRWYFSMALQRMHELGDVRYTQDGYVIITKQGRHRLYQIGDYKAAPGIVVPQFFLPQEESRLSLDELRVDCDDIQTTDDDGSIQETNSCFEGRHTYIKILLISMIPFPGLVRLYTGRIKSGIAQIVLTVFFPPFLIWWFVDFLRVWLCTYKDGDGKSLRDYNRSYALLPFVVVVTLIAIFN